MRNILLGWKSCPGEFLLLWKSWPGQILLALKTWQGSLVDKLAQYNLWGSRYWPARECCWERNLHGRFVLVLFDTRSWHDKSRLRQGRTTIA
ncbi:unnamed protein product [Larinioides sclopetarius]|uniref:Uncharacterized protein n=1 Tax=Larinioides sclopetarius TaxID=280406 RepID=A0AAV1ZGM4_9ARAC